MNISEFWICHGSWYSWVRNISGFVIENKETSVVNEKWLVLEQATLIFEINFEAHINLGSSYFEQVYISRKISFLRIKRFFCKQDFFKQFLAEIDKKCSKSWATPWGWTSAISNLITFSIDVFSLSLVVTEKNMIGHILKNEQKIRAYVLVRLTDKS